MDDWFSCLTPTLQWHVRPRRTSRKRRSREHRPPRPVWVNSSPEEIVGASTYAFSTTTFVFTGVRSYSSSMSCVSRPTQPLEMPLPIVSGRMVL